MLNFLWKLLLFFTLLDCFIIIVCGGLWVLNVWVREMIGKDIAKTLYERWENHER